jgi:hypothetical protein
MISVFNPPLQVICFFSFFSISYFHCPDWYSCAQTEIAKDWGFFLCDTVHCHRFSTYLLVFISWR